MTQLDIFTIIEEDLREEEAQQPTFLIEYYCEDRAQRLTWLRAKNEDAARRLFENKYQRCIFSNIELSDRTIEELDALN